MRLADGSGNLGEELRAKDSMKTEARRAARVLEIRPRLAAELEDVQVLANQHARRSVSREQQPIGFALDRGLVERARVRPSALESRDRRGAEIEIDGARRGRALIEPVLFVGQGKQVVGLADGLGWTQQESSGRL